MTCLAALDYIRAASKISGPCATTLEFSIHPDFSIAVSHQCDTGKICFKTWRNTCGLAVSHSYSQLIIIIHRPDNLDGMSATGKTPGLERRLTDKKVIHIYSCTIYRCACYIYPSESRRKVNIQDLLLIDVIYSNLSGLTVIVLGHNLITICPELDQLLGNSAGDKEHLPIKFDESIFRSHIKDHKLLEKGGTLKFDVEDNFC